MLLLYHSSTISFSKLTFKCAVLFDEWESNDLLEGINGNVILFQKYIWLRHNVPQTNELLIDILLKLGSQRFIKMVTCFINNYHPQLFKFLKNVSRILELNRFSGELKRLVVLIICIYLTKQAFREFRLWHFVQYLWYFITWSIYNIVFIVFYHTDRVCLNRSLHAPNTCYQGAKRIHSQQKENYLPKPHAIVHYKPQKDHKSSIKRKKQGNRINEKTQNWKHVL